MTPPRLARALLSALLPYDHRRVVLSDLDDEFVQIAATRSRVSARAWYWWQVVTSLPGAVRLRSRYHWRDFGRDVRHGGRLLRRNPAFASAAILTLMIGIGATSAVMTVANAVLLRPLPYADPDRVISLAEVDLQRDGGSGNVSWPDFLDYARQSRSFEALAGYNGGSRTLLRSDAPAERLAVADVTGRFFDVLGVRPALGRAITDADTVTNAPPVVMLTDRVWRSRFGADTSLVGRTINLNGVSTTVIGVLPATFEFPPRGLAELWVPMRPSASQVERKFYHWLNTIGRLRPGVSVSQASDEANAIARRFAADDPRYHANSGARVTRLSDAIIGDARPILLVLMVAAVCVLLVACANIAGLLLSRSAARAVELDVRAALGASRSRLTRQLLAESLALAVPGGLFGLLLGQWAVRLFVAAIPRGQRAALPHLDQLGLDTSAVLISLGLSLAAAMLFGLWPALRSARQRLALQSTRGGVGGSVRDIRAQSALIAVQVALALMLLFGAGLLTQSIQRLLDVSPGFSPDGLLTFSVSASGPRYETADGVRAFHAESLARLSSIPGVTGAATIDRAALSGAGNSGGLTIVGATDTTEHTVLLRTVSSNYFDVMGIRRIAGPGFTAAHGPGAPRVVMVNQLAADHVFGGAAIGKRITFPFLSGNPQLEIVGVVSDERFDALDKAMQPVVYFPYAQDPDNAFSVMLRTAGDPSALVASVRSELAQVDSSLPVYNVATMNAIMALSPEVFQRRSVMVLLTGFAVAAVLLAAVGLYGVLAQVVAQRSREIGVRVALGATAGRIVGAILRPGLVATALGLVGGLAGCVLVGRALASLLFDTTPTDPITLLAVVAVLFVVAVLACIAPCRRALRIDPVEVLRRD